MSETYVFDFYNLYIPKEMKYENAKLGVKIIPLKLAEEFQKNRTKFSKPHHSEYWKTAKCFIRSKTEKEAVKIAIWLEFLYSFAQSRSVFFLRWYKHKNGKKYSASASKFIVPRDNGSPEIVSGVYVKKGSYTKDIRLFIDTALTKLSESKEEEQNRILVSLDALAVSCSQTVLELKFLICWIALEKLANNYYSVYKSKNSLFSKEELKNLKADLEKALDASLENDDRLFLVKKSITKNFLYEHNTLEKMILYFRHLDLEFNDKELKKILRNLVNVRVSLVHNLDSDSLSKTPELLSHLRLIMEDVTFRILGIDRNIQKKLLLKQSTLSKFLIQNQQL